MRTEVNSRRACKNFHRAEIADADNVKLSIGEFCVGSDLHAAAEVTRVCDAECCHQYIALVFIVELYEQARRFGAHGSSQKRRAEGDSSAEPLGRVCRQPVRPACFDALNHLCA